MSRLLTIVIAVLLALAIAGGLLWYLAYGIDVHPPSSVTLDSLQTTAEVGWHENDLVTISAENEHDRYAALGYVHGRSRSWSMVLWRQAALGRLGQWFGPSVLEVDSLTRKLGMASLARTSYDALPADQKALLRAYTAGLNTALSGPSSKLDQEIALLNVEPSPWQPWHTLALERLFAWLSTAPPPADSLRRAGTRAQALFRADRQLRRLLHLHGFQQSTAWVMRDSAGTRLHRRLVHGSSALPLFQEITFQQSDSSYVTGATMPGMPFLWSGQSPNRAWTILPHSSLRIERGSWTDSSAQSDYERLTAGDSVEYLLRIRRQSGILPLRRSPSPSTESFLPATSQQDTAATSPSHNGWLLRWSGLETGTDMAAWKAQLDGDNGSFHLQSGDKITLQSGGDWQVAGNPQERASLSNGVVVGNTPWVHPLATGLDTLARRANRGGQQRALRQTLVGTQTSPDALTENWDCYSAWAAEHAPQLVAAFDSVRRQPPDLVQSAVSYLRNWNYTYPASSIAASIYDTWATFYRDETGQLPGRLFASDTAQTDLSPAPVSSTTDTTRATRTDTLNASYRQNRRKYQILVRVVDSLQAQYGNDLSQWRWERVNPERRLFPVWSADSLKVKQTNFMGHTRYAPLELAGRGHPSSPCWGTSPIQRGLASPAAWQGITSTADWRMLQVQKRAPSLTGFMDRHLIPDRPPLPTRIRPFATPKRTTTLTPASQSAGPSS